MKDEDDNLRRISNMTCVKTMDYHRRKKTTKKNKKNKNKNKTKTKQKQQKKNRKCTEKSFEKVR